MKVYDTIRSEVLQQEWNGEVRYSEDGYFHADACGTQNPQDGQGIGQHDTSHGTGNCGRMQEESIVGEGLYQQVGRQTQEELHGAPAQAEGERYATQTRCKKTQLDGGGHERAPAR